MTESMRPFSIVKDRGFQSLMKTGRPGYWIPSPTTVARDIKQIYSRTRVRIGHLLREYDGRLSFTTDAWTSTNHRAFVAISVHFILRGEPISMLLDLVEVPEVRTWGSIMHISCSHRQSVPYRLDARSSVPGGSREL